MSSPAFAIHAIGDFEVTIDNGKHLVLHTYRNVIIEIDYLDRDMLTIKKRGTLNRVIAVHRRWLEVHRIAELPQPKSKRRRQ